MEGIHPVVMPKWGFEMLEGKVTRWLVDVGSPVIKGQELVEIETSKVVNVIEAPHAGILRRASGKPDHIYACGTLLGVISSADCPEEQIAAYVDQHWVTAKERLDDAEPVISGSVEVAGFSLRFKAVGGDELESVVMIHGFGGSLTHWQALQSRLSARAKSYAMDLPGHGESSKDVSTIESFHDVATVLAKFMESMGIDRTHLVAHSMGAQIAFRLAQIAGPRIKSISLLAPAGIGIPVDNEFVETFIRARTRKEALGILSRLYANQALVSQQAAEDLLKYKRLDGVDVALSKFAQLLKTSDDIDMRQFQQLARPLRVIWGAKDEVVKWGPRQFNLPPDSEVVVLENVGHMVHLEAPSETYAAIVRFLASLP